MITLLSTKIKLKSLIAKRDLLLVRAIECEDKLYKNNIFRLHLKLRVYIYENKIKWLNIKISNLNKILYNKY